MPLWLWGWLDWSDLGLKDLPQTREWIAKLSLSLFSFSGYELL